ncbi:MAG: alpha/beta hydrolase [Acidiferrobacterales bacterium]|nr:alpha/beta hydrolase [Acidiferrobacterales bacterium]
MPQLPNGTAYELTGNPGNPAVVLIHGLGLNRQMWRDYVPALSRRHHVLTYDLYGYGESRRVPSDISLELYSRQLNDLLHEVQVDRCVVIGFSLGGMINRRFGIDYPHRVEALVILNSPHERNPEQQQTIERRVQNTAEEGPKGTLDESIVRWFTPKFRSARPDVINDVRSWVGSIEPTIYFHSRVVLAKGVTELIRPQPPLAFPALVITCENDSGSTPSMSHAIASEIADAQVEIIPELQHLGLMEEPEMFLRPIEEFLRKCMN